MGRVLLIGVGTELGVFGANPGAVGLVELELWL